MKRINKTIKYFKISFSDSFKDVKNGSKLNILLTILKG